MSLFKLLDIDETSLTLPSVTSDKVWEKKRFHDEGLFSEVIFGPVKDYLCKCGEYKVGGKCPTCGVLHAPSSLRRRIYAKIELPVDILSPLAYILITSHPKTRNAYNKILNGAAYNPYTNEFEVSVKFMYDDKLLYGLDALEQFILNNLSDTNNDKLQMLYKLIQIGQFRSRNVIIIPPEFRPITKEFMSELNKFYISYILIAQKPSYGQEVFRQLALLKVQKQHIDYIIDKLSSKKGIFRHKIAGKRLDVSGRAVIIPARIPHTHVEVPKLMLMKMYATEVAREYANKKGITYRQAIDEIFTYYEKNIIPDEIDEIVTKLTTDRYVLLNRQPTLHRGSIIPAKIIPSDKKYTIGIPHLIVDPLNADFDGDQMAIYDTHHQEEAKRIQELSPISPSDGELQYLPKQDIIHTIYKISSDPSHPAFHELQDLLGITISKAINKKELIKILKEKYQENPNLIYDVFKFVEKHLYRTTLSLLDFMIDFDYEIGDDYQTNLELLQKAEKELANKFPKADIIKSGARANFQQIRQITYARGYVADYFGHIVEYPIKHGYIHGLTEEEFFYSAYGTRKAVLDTAFVVGDSGYLTRRLIYVSPNATIKGDNCNTKYTFEIFVKDKDIANRFKYRYYYLENPLVNENAKLYYVDNPEDIIGKTIYLRSPIYCEEKNGICKTCYGKLYEIHKSKNVGFIAAQTLGERSTQLTLRTFHTGGVAEKKSTDGDDKKQEDITTALKQVERIIDKKRPLHSHEDIKDMVLTLYNIFKDYSGMHLVHIETIISQMIYKIVGKQALPYKEYKYKDDFDNVIKVSSKVTPMLISPLLSIFFERPKQALIQAIHDNQDRLTILEKTLLNIEVDSQEGQE